MSSDVISLINSDPPSECVCDRLLDEILDAIFHWYLFHRATDLKGIQRIESDTADMEISPRCLTPLLLVCRRWHGVLYANPALWGWLNLKWWSCTDRLLARSKNAPLSLSWNENHVSHTQKSRRLTRREDLMTFFRSVHVSHLANLQLILNDSRILQSSWEGNNQEDVWSTLPSQSESLIAMEVGCAEETAIHSIPLSRSRTLTTLILENIQLPEIRECIFPRLQTFQAKSPLWMTNLGDFLAFLSNSPRLRTLELKLEFQDALPNAVPDPAVIALHDLERLLLDFEQHSSLRLMNHLTIPKTCRIFTEIESCHTDLPNLFRMSLPPSDRSRTSAPVKPFHLCIWHRDHFRLSTGARLRMDALSPDSAAAALSIRGKFPRTPGPPSAELNTPQMNDAIMTIHRRGYWDLSQLTHLHCDMQLSREAWTALLESCKEAVVEIQVDLMYGSLPFAEAFAEMETRASTDSGTPAVLCFPALRRLRFENTNVRGAFHLPSSFNWQDFISDLSRALGCRKRALFERQNQAATTGVSNSSDATALIALDKLTLYRPSPKYYSLDAESWDETIEGMVARDLLPFVAQLEVRTRVAPGNNVKGDHKLDLVKYL